MLKIMTFVFNPFSENTYLIWDDDSKEAAVIDPGFHVEDEEKQFDDFVSANNLKLKYLINTHGHIDHVLGNAYVKKNYEAEYITPEKDVFMIKMVKQQGETFGMNVNESPEADAFITEEFELRLGETNGKFLFTPGHSPGEYCLYFEEDKICFTGDVLFRESIGRYDLWGGDEKILMDSINTKLLSLPEDVTIYPGHGGSSTIGHEMKNNPYLV